MAISSAGIGSGLDVAKIVEQTVAAEKIPLKKLEYKAEGIQTQISTYGEIKSLTSKLGDSASKLTRDSAWNGVSISSSNPTLSGTMTGIAATGTYNIQVTHLAQAQTTALGGTGGAGGSALAKDQTMGADGTIKLKMGAVEKDISVSSLDTLTKIATKINEAGMGIQASIVTNVDGQERLMLRSKETGTDKAFTVGLSAAPGCWGRPPPKPPKTPRSNSTAWRLNRAPIPLPTPSPVCRLPSRKSPARRPR